ncbi:glycosyltransferase [Cryobacterium sp. TMT4-31]|uniref:glycosyltransferase n=1 Tax=Cryobacterium sp. TMT4-31 TaxID=1259259 RepID=UPI00141AA814|nr:glycosyltransferase [Cryobacterium sp. TMT4-31]
MEETDYPRNARVRQYLSSRGADVTVVMRPRRKQKWREYAAIARLGFHHRSGYDLVVLAEFSTNSFVFSWLVAKSNGALHAVDFFVGKYETIVGDRGAYSPRHPLARLLRLLDRAALCSADVAFSDTEVRAHHFEALSASKTPVRSLPVGAPAWVAKGMEKESLPRNDRDLHVLYYGHYIDLHGADVLLEGIIQAAKSIPIRATFVGEGNIKSWMVNRVRESGLEDRIGFTGFEVPEVLMSRVSQCDVVLGIFGLSPKAESVIANKVWQGLYAGKTVLTRRSNALDEISSLAGDRLIQVEPGNPDAIAASLGRLYRAQTASERPSSPLLSEVLEQYVVQQFDDAFARWPLEGLLSRPEPHVAASEHKPRTTLD